ncbi:1-phosphofructokinase family hexose kinase [Dictyoglomus thermophilum]|uniref:1-phosphofructokinase, putative n=2 Tax=Dictyoglomus thermophilum TaxID=14 RepID=B5YDH5_DICT6|nr:1-phosphofructokinase family hexose kinase [Dictyoglomus thermophilum]ACI19673.1 1-phosphofructokinase, putative [Dictyoglomus thermophilum H-6-12]MCX7721290.1 1-phosphofructokinase family hexose kinase [Dictyoglomus thermophilum]
MILVVNINPSLDIVFYTQKFQKNKVNRSYKEEMIPGGKGINVAKTLKAFGEKVKIIGFCGGSTGIILKEELNIRDIDYEFVETKGKTRFAIGIKEDKKNTFTVLNGAGNRIRNEEWEKFFKIFRENVKNSEIVIISGSVPPETPAEIYALMLKEIKNPKIIKVVDARDNVLKEALKESPDIVKPNKEEIETLLKFKLKNRNNYIQAISFLKNYNIKYPIISLGKKGALIGIENHIYKSALPPNNGIQWGTGDSFLAGFIYGLKNYKDPIKAIKLACATGYVKTKYVEITQEEQIKEIFNLENKVRVTKIY